MKRLAIITGIAVALASATVALADDAYIESDGTTFVNSRWHMRPNGRIEIDFARTEASAPSSWLYLFGASDRDASSTIGTRVGMFVNVNGPYFVAGDAVDKWISPGTAPDTERRIAAIDVRAMKYCYYVKGQPATSNNLNAASTVSSTATYPVALFGNMNHKGGLTAAGSSSLPSRIYRARFWTGDHLDHDYTPCVKGGVPGFIDAVDGAFVTAEKPAALTASPDSPSIADDGYVSTVGNYTGKPHEQALIYKISKQCAGGAVRLLYATDTSGLMSSAFFIGCSRKYPITAAIMESTGNPVQKFGGLTISHSTASMVNDIFTTYLKPGNGHYMPNPGQPVYLTHIGCLEWGQKTFDDKMPPGLALAHDGLEVLFKPTGKA